MNYILFPGRHHLLTRFQAQHLRKLLDQHPGAQVVWAITSADHANTRRNPVPASRREAQIEQLAQAEQIPSLVYHIPDVPPTERFASYLLQEIEVLDGPRLSPANTLVACSTPAVANLFASQGFELDYVELAEDGSLLAPRPWDVMEMLLAAGQITPQVAKLMHPASVDIFTRYGLVEHCLRVHADPLATSDGGLTEWRDYESYISAFQQGAERKWAEIRDYVRPGRIVDIGCGVGSLLEQAARDPRFVESDLYGIEAARPMYEACLARKSRGAFANPNTFFHQRNIMQGEIFPDRSINTTITAALTHEIYSYLGEDQLQQLIGRIHRQLTGSGVWINLDVVGPEHGEDLVQLHLVDHTRHRALTSDLSQLPPAHDLSLLEKDKRRLFLNSLSPVENWIQFAHDFRGGLGYDSWRLHTDNGRLILETSQRLVMEWLSKCAYTESWLSEMQESFCHWDWPCWQRHLESAGFKLLAGSGPQRNEWLVTNRFAPLGTLTNLRGRTLDWPHTHVRIIAQPRRG